MRRAGEIRFFAGDADGEPLLRRALVLAEHAHGERGLGTVSIRLSLARFLAYRGQRVEARMFADRALEDALRSTSGSSEPFQLHEVRRLVLDTYLAQDDIAAARALAATAIADLGASAPDSFLHADLLCMLAVVQVAERNFDAAQQTLDRAAEMARRLGMGGNTPLGRSIAVLEAQALLDRGHAPAALQRLQAMPAAAGRGSDDERPRGLIARALAESGRGVEAAAFVDDALREIEAAGDRQRHFEDEALLLLVRAGLQQREGGCAAALPALERAVELHRRLFVPGSPRRLAAEAALAQCRNSGDAAAPAAGTRLAGTRR
jgi:tetratricopeptide (TPR) repeat protein